MLIQHQRLAEAKLQGSWTIESAKKPGKHRKVYHFFKATVAGIGGKVDGN